MNIESFTASTIPALIYKFHEEKNGDWRRPHLGASIIGRECSRQIWYSFHWCKAPAFDGRMLRLFETGNLAEDRLFKELRGIGIKVHSQQKNVPLFPHFGGSIDGIGEGFPESKVPHLLEVKTANAKSWKDTSEKGVLASKPEHYAQMQTYMGGLGLTRAYYFMINKDTDEIYAERIKFDKGVYIATMDKAEQIIKTASPKDLPRVASGPAYPPCRWCDYKQMCHGKDKPEVNCRTCLHSTPIDDGLECHKHGGTMPVDFQREGCLDHLFIPSLLNMEAVDSTADSVEYENGWTNKNNSLDYVPTV